SEVGGDTLVHVQMNYAPARVLRSALSPFSGDLEGHLERALREIKAGLEQQRAPGNAQTNVVRATGTHGAGPELLKATQPTRFGPPLTPVESGSPPEAKR